MPREPRWLAVCQLVALWLVAIVGAAALFRTYRGYVFEDAYITYRYAKNLAAGLGFVFQEGERVLGTMPLYTLILGLGGRLGADIPTLSAVLFSGAIGAIAVLGGLLLRRLGSPNAALLFATACVCGFSQCVHYFGLETPLLTALLLGAVTAAVRGRDLAAGVLAALAVLTRYDAALFAILFFIALGMRRRRVPWIPGLVASAMVLSWLSFARIYFGSWLPNTLGAKQGLEPMLGYLVRSAQFQLVEAWKVLQHLGGEFTSTPVLVHCANAVIVLGALIAIQRLWKREPLLLLLPAHAFALWLGYSVIGPPLPFRWYLMPAAFLMFWTGLAGISLAIERFALTRARAVATLALVALAMWLQPRALASDLAVVEDANYRWRIGGYAQLGDWIVERELDSLTLLTMEPGYFTYRSGNPVIDGGGLVSKLDDRAAMSFTDLTASREPALIVHMVPYRPEDYAIVQTAHPFVQLLMSSEEHRRRFDTLNANFAAASAPAASGLLQHPFELDIEPASKGAWRDGGGELLLIGRPAHVTYDGVALADRCLYLRGMLNGAQTPRFLIDFDRLEFRLMANRDAVTVVQLIVGGRVVLEQGGDPRSSGEMQLVSWSVRAWKGRSAQLRFVNASGGGGQLAADHIHSRIEARTLQFDDFESDADLGSRWQSETLVQSTDLLELARDLGVELCVSKRAATTHALAGTHSLSSKPFTIDHDRISFLMFDFGPSNTSVSLLVDGQVGEQVRGRAARTPRPVTWNLEKLRGRQAVLRMLDDEPLSQAWIGIDDVYFSDR